MKFNKNNILAIIFLLLFSFGCKREEAVLQPHDEVLVYSLPMDLAFLRVVEAAEVHPDWEPDWTDKEKGIIHLRNVRYSSFADADRREATLLVQHRGPEGITIQLDPQSQSVVGGDEILNLIRKALSEEAARRQ